MNRKEDTVFCYYVHNSVWTCELGYGADTMFHRTYFLFLLNSTKKSYALYRMVMLPIILGDPNDIKPPQFLQFALPYASS